MRNVLFFAVMISTIIMISAQAKRNRQENIFDSNHTESYIEQVLGLGMKMIYVKGGPFILGTVNKGEGYSDEYPAVESFLDSYYIGAFEVTSNEDIKNKRVLLIDDVMTIGACPITCFNQ